MNIAQFNMNVVNGQEEWIASVNVKVDYSEPEYDESGYCCYNGDIDVIEAKVNSVKQLCEYDVDLPKIGDDLTGLVTDYYLDEVSEELWQISSMGSGEDY